MAASTTPSSTSVVTKKNKTNHTRLCRLLTDIGTRVLRGVFDTQHPPAGLQKHLNSTTVHAKLNKLRLKKVIYVQQWDKLYPPSGVPSSTTFDITLLFLLLRNICGLTPPTTGWDAAPLPSDLSKGADLVRVKRCRNEITGHSAIAELSDVDFESIWKEVEAALIRLGGSQYEQDIQLLRIGSIDPENEADLKILLQSWEEGEDKKFEVLMDVVKDSQVQLGRAENNCDQRKLFCSLPKKPSHDTINRPAEVDTVIKEISRLRTAYPNHVTVTYLSGNPGCGKSELARQIGEKHFDELDESSKFVATLNASSQETLLQSYVELACPLQCQEDLHIIASIKSENKSQDQESKLAHLQAVIFLKLQVYSSWLMIIDNVEDIKMVSKFVPSSGQKLLSGKGHILITTQDTHSIPGSDSHTHHLSLSHGMNLHDAIQSLNEISASSGDEKITKKVCKKLDFQPLALACAAMYMRQTRKTDPSMNWERYLQEVEKGNRNFADQLFKNENLTYPISMKSAVTIAVQKSLEINEVLRHAFEFIGAIAPEFIQLQFVVNYVLQCMPELDRRSVAVMITSCSLIVTSKDEQQRSIRVHQVVHDVLKSVYQTTIRQPVDELSFFTKFTETFSFIHDMNDTEAKFFANTAPLVQHFVCFTETVSRYLLQHQILKVLQEGDYDEQHLQPQKLFTHQYLPLATFLGKIVSRVCKKHFQYSTARKASEIYCCFVEHNYGNEDTRVAHALSTLGDILGCLYAHEEAEKYHRRALAIKEKSHGINHPQVATTLNNLGIVLQGVRKLDEAKDCHERALAIKEKSYGKNHPQVATTLNNLGMVLKDVRKLDEAEDCYERALAIKEKSYGINHPEVASTLNNLGNVLHDVRKFDEAKDCYERALAIEEKSYGINHPEVASTLNNLGNVLLDVRKFDEAKDCYERALAIEEKSYGRNHPEVALTFKKIMKCSGKS